MPVLAIEALDFIAAALDGEIEAQAGDAANNFSDGLCPQVRSQMRFPDICSAPQTRC
jgi:hypothetical protein